jgi:hypothetical protein
MLDVSATRVTVARLVIFKSAPPEPTPSMDMETKLVVTALVVENAITLMVRVLASLGSLELGASTRLPSSKLRFVIDDSFLCEHIFSIIHTSFIKF